MCHFYKKQREPQEYLDNGISGVSDASLGGFFLFFCSPFVLTWDFTVIKKTTINASWQWYVKLASWETWLRYYSSPASKLTYLLIERKLKLNARKLKKTSGVSKMCTTGKGCATTCPPKELTSPGQCRKAIFSVTLRTEIIRGRNSVFLNLDLMSKFDFSLILKW